MICGSDFMERPMSVFSCSAERLFFDITMFLYLTCFLFVNLNKMSVFGKLLIILKNLENMRNLLNEI